MFAYDIGILKRADRLRTAFGHVARLAGEFKALAAPHAHELVRLKETEAMLLAARLILGASLFRTESRLSHFREDFEARDDTTGWSGSTSATRGTGRPSARRRSRRRSARSARRSAGRAASPAGSRPQAPDRAWRGPGQKRFSHRVGPGFPRSSLGRARTVGATGPTKPGRAT